MEPLLDAPPDGFARPTGLRGWLCARWAVWALLAVAAFTCLLGLGRDLTSPDEGRYAQIAEELRSFEHGARGLVLLHLNGAPYDQKPPLWFWLAALAGVPGGRVSEQAARLPSALAGIATLLLAVQLGTRMFGRRTGLVAGAVLLTAVEFAVLARRASLDALLTGFTTLALVAFWRWDRRRENGRSALAWMHAALGLAVLTKGPVGFLVPVLAIAAYLAWERRLRELRRVLPPWGLALSLGPGLAWLAAATALAPDGYLASAVGDNLFGRFFVGTHEAPFYYYLTQFPQQFLPWTLAWPVVAWLGVRRIFASSTDPEVTRAWRFLLCWVAVTLLFFSVSSGKRGIYLLPAYPGAALLCADALVRWLEGRRALPARAIAVSGAGLGLAAAGAAVVALVDPGWTGVSLRSFSVAILACAVAAAAALRLQARGRLPLAASASLLWLALAAAEVSSFLLLEPAIDAQRSARELGARVAAAAGQEQPIVLFRERSLLGGLAYYSERRPVFLASRRALRELLGRGEVVMVFERRDLAVVEEIARLGVEEHVEIGHEHFIVAAARSRDLSAAAVAAPAERAIREAAR